MPLASSMRFMSTVPIRRGTRAVDRLCGCGGGTDARTFPKANQFVAYISPVLEREGFIPVVPFSPAEFEGRPAVVAKFVLSDEGESQFIDIMHVGEEGYIYRSWIPAESAELDLSDFMKLSA